LPEKKEQFLFIAKELKSIIGAEGLLSYNFYESKPNHYQEIYTFESEEAFEAFDDDSNRRVNILTAKLSSILKNPAIKYLTLKELEF